MKTSSPFLLFLALVLGTALIAPPVHALSDKKDDDEKAQGQEKEKKAAGNRRGKKKKNDLPPEVQAVMDASKLQKEHEELASKAGAWNVACKFWMDPTAPPVETTGKARIRPILGGRYVREEFRCDFMGFAYQGQGIVGYDSSRKVYFSTWIDNMTNAHMRQEGKIDEKGTTVTYHSEMLDPFLQVPVKKKMTVEELGGDSHRASMYMVTDQGEFKTMELTYTRQAKKTAPKKGKIEKPKPEKVKKIEKVKEKD